jgi:hypothetical protein
MVGRTMSKFKLHAPLWTCLGVAVLGDHKMRVETRVTAFRDDKDIDEKHSDKIQLIRKRSGSERSACESKSESF